MNKDLGTTILGGILAAGTAAQPVVEAANGNWNTQTITGLVMSVVFAVFGFFTNKQ